MPPIILAQQNAWRDSAPPAAWPRWGCGGGGNDAAPTLPAKRLARPWISSSALPSPLEVQPVELDGVVSIDRARLAFAQPQIGEGAIEDFDPLRHVRRLEEDRVVAGIDRALRAKGLERGFDIGAKVGLGPVRAGVRRQVRELDPHVWITCEVFDVLAILGNRTLLDAGLAA